MTGYTDDDVTAERPDHDYCAWCGWWRERDDSDEDALLLHIMECPKHPLRFGSSKRDAAIAARAAADALVAFADAHRMPFVMFRREDGSAVTVSDLLREESARLRGRAEQVNP